MGEILSKDNLYYPGDEALLYLCNNIMYKIYTKFYAGREDIIDFLITHKVSLGNSCICPNSKLRDDTGFIGFKMDYYLDSQTLYKYLKNTNDIWAILMILKKTSDKLKVINKNGIKIPDFHHNNILVNALGEPIAIDMDDTYVAEVPSFETSHISQMINDLYRIDGNKQLKQMLIKNNNLDRETLFIIFLDYIFDFHVARIPRSSYYKILEQLDGLSDDFLKALHELKREKQQDAYHFEHYLGDFLTDENISKLAIKRLEIQR